MTPVESKPDLQLEIGHVLFIDIVGYSKLLINEQTEALKILNEIVRNTARFRSSEAAGELIRLPTGDGMALVFLDELEAPVECALQISRGLLAAPQFGVRMGVHSGPVNQVADVNGRLNLTGAGINIACRVMDCGDAGHILLSSRVADDLAQYRHWKPHLHDLGAITVKHDIELGLTNLYTDELGNPKPPKKILAVSAAARIFSTKRRMLALLLLLLLVAAGIGLFLFGRMGGARADLKSIAVLPFANLSDEQANAYFAHGIQDEILTRLSKIAGLKVISRTSMQHYKATPDNLPEVARQLGVAHILEGSVQKLGDSVRINVQLIHARTDSHVWAETYDRKLNDILEVETEVAKRIADVLQVKLTGNEQKALDRKFTDNTQAYDAYLRGLNYEGHHGFSAESLDAKVNAYRTAVELDPQFAQAWARLSSAHVWTYYQTDHTPQRLAMAKLALDSALRCGPEAGEVLFALGEYRYGGTQEYEGALEAYQQARERLPSSAEILLRMGGVTRRLGRWEEALVLHTQATRLDPRNAEVWKHQGFTLRGLRRYPEAVTAFERALQAAPGDADLIGEEATTYQMQGDLAAAAKLLDALPPEADRDQLTPRRFNQWVYEHQYEPAIVALKAALEKREKFPRSAIAEALSNLGFVEVLNGQRDSGLAHEAEAKELIESLRQQGDENPWYVVAFGAQTYSLLGDHATARLEAERAAGAFAKDAMLYPQALTVLARIQCEAGETGTAIATLERVLKMNCAFAATPALLRMEPIWDPIRNNPRFQALGRN